MSKFKIIPYIWVKNEIKIEITNDLDYLTFNEINKKYSEHFLKYQGGIILKNSKNEYLFETSDLHYYYDAECFIIRNYLFFKHKVQVTTKNLTLLMTGGHKFYILKNENSYYFKYITKNGKSLPPEIKYTFIDDEKLLSLKLSYIELIEALENSIEAIYNMYKTNYDVLKNNEVFLRYFKYIKNLSTKQNFDGSDDYW